MPGSITEKAGGNDVVAAVRPAIGSRVEMFGGASVPERLPPWQAVARTELRRVAGPHRLPAVMAQAVLRLHLVESDSG